MAVILAPEQPGVLEGVPVATQASVPTTALAEHNGVAIGDPRFHQCPIPSEAKIIDIRSPDTCLLNNLENSILDGLGQPKGCKSLPSLLLWGEQGQRLYDQLLATEEYYPYRAENELLQQRIEELTPTMAASRADLLVELGAGNMSKTALLLCSLDRHLHSPLIYYALDVDRAQLERPLAQLKERTNLRWIKLRGLLGTYDDGAKWLECPERARFRTSLVCWAPASPTVSNRPQANF